MSKFSKEQIIHSIKIRDLFVNQKYAELISEATDYLSIYPNDVVIRFMRAKSYRKKYMFEESNNDLLYNLSIEKNAHSIVQLYNNYYFLNMYKEAMELLPELYENKFMNQLNLKITESVMKRKLGYRLKETDNYVLRQINEYDKQRALEHINIKHKRYDLQGRTTIFYDNVDVEYLYDSVVENLKNSKKANIEEALEIHFFALSNIGISNNNICNFIKVVVVPNTTNIISLYPVETTYDSEFTVLHCDRDKLIKREKVKTISQKDKFNARYKRV